MTDLGPECRACRLVRGRYRLATHRDVTAPERLFCDEHSIWWDEPLPDSERARLERPDAVDEARGNVWGDDAQQTKGY